ncbi:MAG: nicotinate-nucleotide adenylyltransferase, partial [Alphaproteobacteria bacterium]
AMPTLGRDQRIGLLGGSFNPAHDGHLHISQLALDRLGLDSVWWLVSPQNPLKSPDDMADFSERLRYAERLAAANPRIVVTGIERELDTRYTSDTVEALKRRYPMARFVLVMGADLLVELPKWKNWQRLFKTVPIAVFARPSYSLRALAGKAARRFRASRISRARWSKLAGMRPPAWAFLRTEEHPQSSTRIRTGRK